MPTTAHAAAQALRLLADSLDRQPEAVIVQPWLFFSHSHGGADAKDQFIALAKLLPRPLKKSAGYDGKEYRLDFVSDSLSIHATIERSKVCRVLQPAQEAVYECEPLLSNEEDAALTES